MPVWISYEPLHYKSNKKTPQTAVLVDWWMGCLKHEGVNAVLVGYTVANVLSSTFWEWETLSVFNAVQLLLDVYF